MDTSKSLSCVHQQMFENWPETQSREKGESAYDQNRGDQQTSKQYSGYRECASRLWNWLLFRQASGNGEHRDDHEEPAEELRSRSGRVVPHRVCVDPGKGRAIVSSRRNI